VTGACPDALLLMVKLDIVRFHDVNNGFGYEVGDALLRAAVSRLATTPSIAVARRDKQLRAGVRDRRCRPRSRYGGESSRAAQAAFRVAWR